MSVSQPGHWPVDPQEDQEISKDRMWVDGCFDFAHHGHAGAILQARQAGKELWVGVHSDEAILENKGPAVMNLEERVAAVDACRWVTRSVPHAPYVTEIPWISHYGCWYVVHGDDITSDAGGEDTYRYVKSAGRFHVVKRTPGISTTDLVGRMLLCTKTHFIKSLEDELDGSVQNPEHGQTGQQMLQRIKDYATDETGLHPGSQVWIWKGSTEAKIQHDMKDAGTFSKLVDGNEPKQGQRIVYVDGGFDLFSPGHIAFLKKVNELEQGGAYIVAGIHDDQAINHWKGLNYPIMNIFERGLCVLQCRYVHAIVFSAPFAPSKAYLDALPVSPVSAVYHGPTAFMPLAFDPYTDAKDMGIFKEAGEHAFAEVDAGQIVMRIMKSRQAFEDRQRRKGQKAVGEQAARQREILEQQAAEQTVRTAQ